MMQLGEESDGLHLDTTLFELRRDGDPVAVEPQVFDVLTYLVAHRDRVVPKEELMDAVWGGRFVSETAVTSRIKQVRRALGDDGQAQRLVRTLHGRGYRFVGAVRDAVAPGPGGAAPAPDHDTPPTGPVRYTRSDGLHIAYQVTGGPDDGPRPGAPDIVLISGFVSHLELDWGDPRHAHFLHRLAGMGRLIRFDKRGTGMSDRPEGIPDLETRMHDVLAVMDAAGSRQAVVCGYSEGGPMAILLAASHPERVGRLVLYASYAKRSWAEDYPWAQTVEERRTYTDLLVDGWDWEADLRMRSPSADESMQRWWALRMRASATPGTIRALMNMNDLIDVRSALPAVRVPTLVLHRRHDALFKVEEAEYLAGRIPDARLEVLEGSDHFVAGDSDQILDAMEPFVTGRDDVDEEAPAATALAAVMALVGPEGDCARVVEALQRLGGRSCLDPDGRHLVLFDGPARAVRASRQVGLGPVSGGLSVAELPTDVAVAGGPLVARARELAEQAPAGELWADQLAGLLMTASHVELEPRTTPSGDHVHLAR